MLVKDAAVVLDRINPGWHQRIDTSTLSLISSEDCIVGQLYGGFFSGMLHLWDTHAFPFFMGKESPFICFNEDKTTQWLNEIFERRIRDGVSSEQRELVAA